MMSKLRNGQPKLRIIAQLVLFSSSYLPLSLLLLIRMALSDLSFISSVSEISLQSVLILTTTIVLSIMFLLGSIGLWLFIKQMKRDVSNGFPQIVKEVYNKKAETIGYIATYIIPFVFQTLNTSFEYIALLLFLGLIFSIYRDSVLLTINPVLCLFYSTYEVKYEENGIVKNGILIIDEYDLVEEDKVIMYKIGKMLYFGKTINKEVS